MNATEAVGRLSEIVDSLAAQGFDTRPLVVDSPASPGEVDAVEGQLGCKLPTSLRHCLTAVASRVEFAWFAPTGHTFPDPFREIFSGNLRWSLNGLPDLITAVRGWVDDVFPDPSDPYDRVWHHKLPFMEVGNGDYLALDLDEDEHGRVVYLSHDDGEGHGRTMATSFEDLLIRWIPLACPGAEDWQWLPFCARSDGGLDPSSAIAREWTALVHLKSGPPAVEGL
ncbi:SMI1/KNR4 family protein [Micromonospora sp. RTP1Z1]|uniref:SMI1/KNR4 family protein n=1 Tax=Micromonospora sp. RTP1Z1 TaxID=2994043 RepID=UPI0029C7D151|nr:SMI1/KNR4 family protein [Micromonospora sp. RTP1Z1]